MHLAEPGCRLRAGALSTSCPARPDPRPGAPGPPRSAESRRSGGARQVSAVLVILALASTSPRRRRPIADGQRKRHEIRTSAALQRNHARVGQSKRYMLPPSKLGVACPAAARPMRQVTEEVRDDQTPSDSSPRSFACASPGSRRGFHRQRAAIFSRQHLAAWARRGISIPISMRKGVANATASSRSRTGTTRGRSIGRGSSAVGDWAATSGGFSNGSTARPDRLNSSRRRAFDRLATSVSW